MEEASITELTRKGMNFNRNINFNEAIQSMITDALMIEYGVIKEVLAEGVVEVITSVARTDTDIKLYPCAYANIASKNITVNIAPEVDDKVIVLFPRRFDGRMFDVSENEIILNPNAKKRSLLSGIAIPFSQFKTTGYDNVLNLNKDELELKMFYDDSVHKITLNADKDGAFSVANTKAEFSVDKDGKISIDNGKALITVDTSGNVEIDAKNGKIDLKNTAGGQLGSVLADLIQHISSLTTTNAVQGSPCTLSPATIAQLTQDSTKLQNLLAVAPSPST